MNTLVIGAGIIGCHLTYRFLEHGINVSLLARGEKIHRFRNHGIILRNQFTNETRTIKPTIVQGSPEDIYDTVFICVQAMQQPSILDLLTPLKSCKAFVFVGNNIQGFRFAVDVLGKKRVLGGFSSAGGTWKNGELHYADSFSQNKNCHTDLLILGSVQNEGKGSLRNLVRQLQTKGYKTKLYSPIQAWHLCHGALICGLAGAIYAKNENLHALAEDRHLLTLSVRAIKEGLVGVRKNGLPIYPLKLRIFLLVPVFLLRIQFQILFRSPLARIALAAHANTARNEMETIARGILELCRMENCRYGNIQQLWKIPME